MEACDTSHLDEPKYLGLVEVVLGEMYCGLSSGVCELRSFSTTGGGADDDSLIVMCLHSGLSWVALVESLDCVFCIVEVFCWVQDFVIFWSVAFPLISALDLVVVESRVDDFIEFVFVFSLDRNRRRGSFDLRAESVALVRFKEVDVEGLVYGDRGW